MQICVCDFFAAPFFRPQTGFIAGVLAVATARERLDRRASSRAATARHDADFVGAHRPRPRSHCVYGCGASIARWRECVSTVARLRCRDDAVSLFLLAAVFADGSSARGTRFFDFCARVDVFLARAILDLRLLPQPFGDREMELESGACIRYGHRIFARLRGHCAGPIRAVDVDAVRFGFDDQKSRGLVGARHFGENSPHLVALPGDKSRPARVEVGAWVCLAGSARLGLAGRPTQLVDVVAFDFSGCLTRHLQRRQLVAVVLWTSSSELGGPVESERNFAILGESVFVRLRPCGATMRDVRGAQNF